MSEKRKALKKVKRCVVKIGSALLADAGKGININAIENWVKQLAGARQRGIEIVLVTSGSVAVGMQRMDKKTRPHALNELQALAAIGQMGLIQTYESAFQAHGLHTAQVLLTHDDLADRKRHLNARSTIRSLIDLGVIPIINENDTVATEEIRFGDNDTLAAQVANLVEADLLVILTDQDGLFDRDPTKHENATLVSEGKAGDPALLEMAGGSGSVGRGGMRTKLIAAAQAARSGTATIIAHGARADVLQEILEAKPIGTYLKAAQGRIAARKQWLASQARVQGRIYLDAGAVSALQGLGKSLLPVGVKGIEGNFSRGEVVACFDDRQREVARGLVNYSAEEAGKIVGQSSDQIEAILGYVDEPELIHRDNMVLL